MYGGKSGNLVCRISSIWNCLFEIPNKTRLLMVKTLTTIPRTRGRYKTAVQVQDKLRSNKN